MRGMSLRRPPTITLQIALLLGSLVGSASLARADDDVQARSLRVVLRVDDTGTVSIVSARESLESLDSRTIETGDALVVETVTATGATHRTASVDPRLKHVDFATPDGTLSGGIVRRTHGLTVMHIPMEAASSGLTATVSGTITSLRLPRPSPLPNSVASPRDPGEIQVVTLRSSGDPAARQDIVFLAEGYLDDQLERFLDDVERVLDRMEEVEPYVRYLTLVNVHAVFVGSVEAGADHPEADPPLEVETALNCTYGAFDIARLIDCDPILVVALAGEAPGEDVRVVLVNDDAYGGSGGADFAVVFTGPLMESVAIHEMGHSDALLADEYSYHRPYPGFGSDSVNCARFSNERGWQDWIDVESPGVGSFDGCSWTDWYRPTDQACLMNVLDVPYCVVCREQVVKAIHTHIPNLIEGQSPPPNEFVELTALSSVTLSLDIPDLSDGALHVVWEWVEREEELAAGLGVSELTIDALDLAPGEWTIEARVEDRTEWVLDDPFRLLEDRVTFFINVSETGDDDALDDDDDGEACENRACDDGCSATDPGAAMLPIALVLGIRRRS
jgi:hypothetical protein